MIVLFFLKTPILTSYCKFFSEYKKFLCGWKQEDEQAPIVKDGQRPEGTPVTKQNMPNIYMQQTVIYCQIIPDHLFKEQTEAQ